ncbi:major facilitator superfamily permease [Actinoplanes friuliensis DSM 7358]|uniref:Major facilitator superfamily permease n=1 Tax=Actinoplanes friuliensis DSM 7358 TaxID=1246995 RepID=U5VTD2_9ACTN|nr:major facilitator superfamily permease [Actinoplanes friuliensis DSM 7358]
MFRTTEFKPLFASSATQVAAGTLSSLAFGTLIYARTGSPLLAALSMFGPSFAQVVGAMLLMSAADRLRPRTAVALIGTVFGAGNLVLALPGMPLGAMFAVILVMGLAGSVGGGARAGLLGQILPPEGYILGRSMLNLAVGVMQILGYAAGGVLVALMSPRTALVLGGLLCLIAALIARLGLSDRPPRATGRPSIAATWQVNRVLWSSPARRAVFLSLWVPNGLVVGAEALFVPYAPQAAGALFIAGAAGMLAGDLSAGRFLPARLRPRFVTPFRLLLAAPYLLFVLPLTVPVAVVLVAVASVGFGAGLLLQERLIGLTDETIRGQALGLHGSGLMTMQAVGATIAGVIAQHLPVGTAIAIMGTLSLVVTLLLTPGLRLSRLELVDQR